MGFTYKRIKIDIKDLSLDKLLDLDYEKIIFVAKHLCGVATCLTLEAISNLKKTIPNMYLHGHD